MSLLDLRAAGDPDINTAMLVARHEALQQRTRKNQINHYRRHGPVPATPMLYADSDPGDGVPSWERVGDFPATAQLEHRIIGLILDGAPAHLFAWNDPPTTGSLWLNKTAPSRWQAIQRPPRPRNKAGDPPVHGATEYGLEGLLDEYNILAGASEGERNNQANISAFNLGQLVASGDLPEALVVEQLWDAATATGLPTSEIRTALRSGLEAGKRTPRSRR